MENIKYFSLQTHFPISQYWLGPDSQNNIFFSNYFFNNDKTRAIYCKQFNVDFSVLTNVTNKTTNNKLIITLSMNEKYIFLIVNVHYRNEFVFFKENKSKLRITTLWLFCNTT